MAPRAGPRETQAGLPADNRWTVAERARHYADASCPPTWRTSSPSTGPGPELTAARSVSWSNRRRAPQRPVTSPARCVRVGSSCIAEIKRRSPSKGDLDPGLQPDLVAKEYVAGGAACLSVLTDADFFGGSADDLASARQASGLPVLRKDFTVQQADVADARLMGADAVLLIVAALDDDELRALRGARGQAGPGRTRRGARRGGARPRAGRRVRPGRGQPARPAHASTSTTSAPAPWPRAYRPASSPSPSRASGTRPTPGGWPRPATTPSWSARRWCGRRTGWAGSRSWSGHPVGTR